MMDEKLISEVQQHAIIYNRQKSSTINGDKCITKELAWQDIARNLNTDGEYDSYTISNKQINKSSKTDFIFLSSQLIIAHFLFAVDSCKKRWKYLRERYVQQKKVGGSPASYEHLSRPYLEKMKFLDNFIQSRKSYRQVSQLFQSPSGMQGFDGNESSKSNGSMRLVGNHINNDLEDAFPQYYLNQFPPHVNLRVKSEESLVSDRKTNDLQSTNNNMPSSSSSIASQESPATLMSISTTHDSSVTNRKRRRTTSTNISERNNSHNLNHIERTHDTHQNQILNNNLSDHEVDHNSNDDDDDDASESSPMNNVPTDFLYPLYEQQSSRTRKPTTEHVNPSSSTFPNPIDLLHPLYQQAIARQLRNSDQLLGELVTSELMKMSKDRKKVAQRKILEILFFDDE